MKNSEKFDKCIPGSANFILEALDVLNIEKSQKNIIINNINEKKNKNILLYRSMKKFCVVCSKSTPFI